ncbi:MAG: coproporphyrinogen III oxidase family protein [Clostridiales bacterium]|jgi:oxygen-independent coproporphyrinogen-3 oxidase|nr:coproporphyrinogen III oxidase family protein [Clostridiales bacterium]
MIKPPLGIYIHIPFCVSKCAYCDFYSLPCCNRETDMRTYVERLCRDIQKYAPRFQNRTVDTVYFGGGTPTVLYESAIFGILRAVSDNFSVSSPEITSEANPESLTLEKAHELKAVGVNRISVGLQAADDGLLKILGRVHTVSDYLRAIENLRAAGFENIGADVMLGLPGQTLRRVEDTLKLLHKQNIPHISAYALKLEKGTPLYRAQSTVHSAQLKDKDNAQCTMRNAQLKDNAECRIYNAQIKEKSETVDCALCTVDYKVDCGLCTVRCKNPLLNFPDDDATADQYDLVYDTLTANGFRRYEVSNFARPGFECRHNLKYWTMGDYLGLGAAAHSFYGGARYANSRSLNYRTQKTPQTPADGLNDAIMLNLRTERGIDAQLLKQAYGRDLLSEPTVLDLIKKGFLILNGARLAVAPDKFYVMNSIIAQLL